MTIVQHPSPDFPPAPAFRLEIPDDWVALAATSAEMAVSSPEPIDGFHTNVIVTARRVPPPGDPAAALAITVGQELEAAGYDVIESRGFADGRTPAHAATVRFTTDGGIAVEAHQLHVYVPSSGRCAHVLSATGTVPCSAPDDLRAGLMKVVRSLRVASAPSEPATGTNGSDQASIDHSSALASAAPGDPSIPHGEGIAIPPPSAG